MIRTYYRWLWRKSRQLLALARRFNDFARTQYAKALD